MKIVINRCYGGFGVSIAAIREMVGKCTHVKAHDPIHFFGSEEAWKKGLRYGSYYFDEKNWPVTDEHGSKDRNCPILVACIEKLRDAANGDFAKLSVVKIPDGISWKIDEYDGLEHVEETHRTWW